MGGVFEPHWVANARLKPGSPRTIELLPRHNLLAPLGAWSLGKTDRQVVKPPHQANNKETRNHQPYSLLLGTSEQCLLASLTTSSKSMMPGKPPSSTVSCPNSRSTSPPFRRHASPQVAVSRRRTTPSSGRDSSQKSAASTGSDSQCAAPSCLQWSLPLRVPQGSSLSASRPPLDQQTSSASTPPHSALQPRLRMHSMRSLRPRSEKSHRKKTCSYLETSTPG